MRHFTLSGLLILSFGSLISAQRPVIEFNKILISFDTISAGETVRKEFFFRNAGHEALRILRVNASDGGTIVTWPEESILPGKTDKICVEFGFTASRGGFQDKEFTVISNANNNPVVLWLKGYIKGR